MRPGMIILAVLVLGIPGVTASARSTSMMDSYQSAHHGRLSVAASRGDCITIGNPRAERDAVLALLDERRFARSDGTMEGEPDGGSGIGGSAGGVGAR